jgi:hypothetical protein
MPKSRKPSNWGNTKIKRQLQWAARKYPTCETLFGKRPRSGKLVNVPQERGSHKVRFTGAKKYLVGKGAFTT